MYEAQANRKDESLQIMQTAVANSYAINGIYNHFRRLALIRTAVGFDCYTSCLL